MLAIVIGSWSVAAAVLAISAGLAGGYFASKKGQFDMNAVRRSATLPEGITPIRPLPSPSRQNQPTIGRRDFVKYLSLASVIAPATVAAVPSSGLWTSAGGFYSGHLTGSARDGSSEENIRAIEAFLAENPNPIVGPIDPAILESATELADIEVRTFNTATGLAAFTPIPLSKGLFPFKAGSKPGTLYIPINDFSATAELGFHGRIQVRVDGRVLEYGTRVDERSQDLDLWVLSRPEPDVDVLFEGARLAILQFESDSNFIGRATFGGADPSRRMLGPAFAALALSAASGIAHTVANPIDDGPANRRQVR